MLCEKYDNLMMKYMDGILERAEEAELKAHMEVCSDCFEDFTAYSEILKGFNEMEIAPAPPDFAAKVMKRVVALDLYSSSFYHSSLKEATVKGKIIDGFISAAWVLLVFALFGGAALAFFGAEIFAWMESAGFYSLVNVLAPIADSLSYAVTSFNQFAVDSFDDLPRQNMILYSFSLLLVFVGLVVLQININREKVKNYG
jgi:hypothetical protein